ncbi:MAG: type II secretion system protein [Tepidisphaeraceae bacterium]
MLIGSCHYIYTAGVVEMSRSRNAAYGFSLVELLVVIGVIGLLIALLMPALSQARRSAYTLQCATNLRQIGISMMQYATQNRGAILGNAWTTGAFLKRPGFAASDDNCPEVCQTWDWTAPVARIMGAKFVLGGSRADRTTRFNYLCNYKAFQCPENNILAPAYSSSPIKVTTRMISYNTASLFQYVYRSSGGDISMYQPYINTGNFKPSIDDVGAPSRKIFMSDGARWTNGDSQPPDYNLGWDNSGTSPGGHYADYGPWSPYSRSFLSGKPIVYAMRHAVRKPGSKTKSFRMNAVFFDGHVDTLSGTQALNPSLWMPRGTSLPRAECTTETASLYFGNQSTLRID